MFAPLVKLEELDLSNSPLFNLSETQFVNNANIQTMILERTQLTELPEALFASMWNLTTLTISDTPVAALPAELFKFNTKVQSIDISNMALTSLPSNIFQSLNRLRIIQLQDNQLESLETGLFSGLPAIRQIILRDNSIKYIHEGSLPSVTRLSFSQPVLDMARNPSECIAVLDQVSFAEPVCSCFQGTINGGSFCEDPSQIKCMPGTSDHDMDPDTPCMACPVGTFAGFNHEGLCTRCPSGTTDADSDPATPCLPCDESGFYFHEGLATSCDDPMFSCAKTSQIDHDHDSSTPCTDICSVCSCEGLKIDCSGRGLKAIPTATAELQAVTAELWLNDNDIEDLDLEALKTWPLLNSLHMENNKISLVSQEFSDYAGSTALNFFGDKNPSSCSYGGTIVFSGCLCASGFQGAGFCEEATNLIPCPASYVDHDTNPDTDCIYCSTVGAYIPAGSFGACNDFLCKSGTTDHDLDASTPCEVCPPGTYAPEGSTGTCKSLQAPAGQIDHDADPATPPIDCPAGYHTPPGAFGSCEAFICAEGTIDDDSNPATECISCDPGAFVPRGNTGSCSAFLCPSGDVDHDHDPATPCVTLRVGFYSSPGSFGFLSDYTCEFGTTDDDYNPSTPCVNCGPGHYVPRESAGRCNQYACVLPRADLDNDPATPCVLKPEASSKKSGLSSTQVGLFVVFSIIIIAALIFFSYLTLRKPVVPAHDFAKEFDALGIKGQPPREIDQKKLKLLDELGAGAFGTVFKGLLDESTTLGLPSYLVAVKNFPEPSAKERQMIFQEAALMSQVNSEHVVQLVGVISTQDPICIVLQFCEHGALIGFLRKRGHELLLNARLQIAHDIALGMEHITQAGFVHRDLAARNVLIDSSLRAKVADFGHARDVGAGHYYKSTGGQIAIRWAAPEALHNEQFNEATDVWSFAVTCYEIWTNGALPYKEMNNETVWMEVMAGHKLGRPTDCPLHIYQIMLSCLDMDPVQRPTFKQLFMNFTDLLNGDTDAVYRSLQTKTVDSINAKADPQKSGYWTGDQINPAAPKQATSGYMNMSVTPAPVKAKRVSMPGYLRLDAQCAPGAGHIVPIDQQQQLPEANSSRAVSPNVYILKESGTVASARVMPYLHCATDHEERVSAV